MLKYIKTMCPSYCLVLKCILKTRFYDHGLWLSKNQTKTHVRLDISFIRRLLLNVKVATVKMGWIQRDSVSGTTVVRGSRSQYQALMAVHMDMAERTTARSSTVITGRTAPVFRLPGLTYCASGTSRDGTMKPLRWGAARRPWDLCSI